MAAAEPLVPAPTKLGRPYDSIAEFATTAVQPAPVQATGYTLKRPASCSASVAHDSRSTRRDWAPGQAATVARLSWSLPVSMVVQATTAGNWACLSCCSRSQRRPPAMRFLAQLARMTPEAAGAAAQRVLDRRSPRVFLPSPLCRAPPEPIPPARRHSLAKPTPPPGWSVQPMRQSAQ